MGKQMEEAAGRVAHRLGFGPLAVAQRIDGVFSGGPEKTQEVLEMLYDIQAEGQASVAPSWYKKLRKDCCALIKYTLPSKSPEAQIDAFRNIVRLCTWYPQLRILLRGSESKHASSGEILKTWMRKDGEVDEQWEFYSLLTAFCISDNETSELVERCKPAELGKVSYQGSCLVERLIQISDDPIVHSTCRMIAVRYIAGILYLPRFWTEDIARHVTVKLLKMAIGFTQDVVDNISNLKEPPACPRTLDYEGIDMLIERIIQGLHQIITLSHGTSQQVSNWSDLALQLFNQIEGHPIETILPRTYFTWEKIRDVLLFARNSEDDSNEEEIDKNFLSEVPSPANVDISGEEAAGITATQTLRLQLSIASSLRTGVTTSDVSSNDTGETEDATSSRPNIMRPLSIMSFGEKRWYDSESDHVEVADSDEIFSLNGSELSTRSVGPPFYSTSRKFYVQSGTPSLDDIEQSSDASFSVTTESSRLPPLGIPSSPLTIHDRLLATEEWRKSLAKRVDTASNLLKLVHPERDIMIANVDDMSQQAYRLRPRMLRRGSNVENP
ncbi:hypothetical protein M422DRAFT_64374 [Sphaerobolus stellatus SS14]|nr:hypothetical protein M422DRAFT_64374 [Sphaerobolus stellatus SS14]